MIIHIQPTILPLPGLPSPRHLPHPFFHRTLSTKPVIYTHALTLLQPPPPPHPAHPLSPSPPSPLTSLNRRSTFTNRSKSRPKTLRCPRWPSTPSTQLRCFSRSLALSFEVLSAAASAVEGSIWWSGGSERFKPWPFSARLLARESPCPSSIFTKYHPASLKLVTLPLTFSPLYATFPGHRSNRQRFLSLSFLFSLLCIMTSVRLFIASPYDELLPPLYCLSSCRTPKERRRSSLGTAVRSDHPFPKRRLIPPFLPSNLAPRPRFTMKLSASLLALAVASSTVVSALPSITRKGR
jgi:hypothetical protein